MNKYKRYSRLQVSLVILFTLGTDFPVYSEVVISGPVTKESPYQRQLQQRYAAQDQNYKTYGAQTGSFTESQNLSRSNFINRMSGYFSPLNVNVYDSNQLNRAVQYDQLERQNNLQNMSSQVNSNIKTVMDGYAHAVQSVVNDKGELSTYNVATIRNSANELASLSNKAEKIGDYVSSEFRRDYRELATPSYLERTDIMTNSSATDRLVNAYLYGSSDDNKGIYGLKDSFMSSSRQFSSAATKIQDTEDDMRNNMVVNYAVGGLQMVVGAVLLYVPGGQLAGGMMIASGATQAGSTARNNVVINEKGLEGFQSSSESKAALGIQSFQYALAAAQLGSNAYNVASNVSKASAIQNGVTQTGFSALSTGQKAYVAYQYTNTALGVADMTGLTKQAFGEQGQLAAHAAMAGADLAFLGSGLQTQTAARLNPDVSPLLRNNETAHAAMILSKSNPISMASQVVNDAVSVSQISPDGQDLVKRIGPGLQIGMESAKLSSTLYDRFGNNDRLTKAGETIPTDFVIAKYGELMRPGQSQGPDSKNTPQNQQGPVSYTDFEMGYLKNKYFDLSMPNQKFLEEGQDKSDQIISVNYYPPANISEPYRNESKITALLYAYKSARDNDVKPEPELMSPSSLESIQKANLRVQSSITKLYSIIPDTEEQGIALHKTIANLSNHSSLEQLKSDPRFQTASIVSGSKNSQGLFFNFENNFNMQMLNDGRVVTYGFDRFHSPDFTIRGTK